MSVVDDGDLSALAVGDTVRVTGTTWDDDAVAASSVVVGDLTRLIGGGFGGGAGGPGGQAPGGAGGAAPTAP